MSTLRDALLASLGALAFAFSAATHAQETPEDVVQAPPDEVEIATPVETAAATEPAEPMIIEELIVTGRLRDIATDVIAERQEREVVTDLLSADDIARVGDTNVAAALRRLPGVTLVADKFVYVRGLGERYSSSQLNGAEVPSPDLSRDVLPLDIFPTTILDSLVVQKGYTPDRPAAFGGGDINIRTRGVPAGAIVHMELGTGWNSESSDGGISYDGGDSDWLGTDDGTRELPGTLGAALVEFQGDISPANILSGLNRDGGQHTIAEAEQINRTLATSLYRDIGFSGKTMRPDAQFETTLGNRWFFLKNEDLEFGVLGSGAYTNGWRNRPRINRDALNPSTQFTDTERTIQQVNITGVMNFGLQYTDDHQLQSTNIFLRNTEDEAELRLGCTANFLCEDGDRLRTYVIRDEERNLRVNQLRGSHRLSEATLELLPQFLGFLSLAEGLQFDWYWSDAKAETDIPSEIVVSAEDDIDPVTQQLLVTSIRRTQSAADYRFSNLDDDVDSWGYDIQMPFFIGPVDLTLAGGYAYTKKGRTFQQTRFGFGTNEVEALPSLIGTPQEVFTDANMLDPVNGYALQVGGIGTESYLAGQITEGAYGKLDMTWDEHWRLMGGARWERFNQLSVPYDPLQYDPAVGQIPIPADEIASEVVLEDEWYPAMALTYMVQNFWASDFQLRLGYSQTVNRPDLREISRSTYIDPLTEARVRGTPGLGTSDVDNYDLRGEWFFDNGDNFTVSFFYKDIKDPIETVQEDASDNDVGLGFINGDSAEIHGVEVEGLKNLGFASRWVGQWIEQLFIYGNVTVSDSEIDTGAAAVDLTNPQREMTQHSSWVVNLQLGFDSFNGRHGASLAYNGFGERVFFGGKNGAPDAKEQPFHSLDLVYSFYANNHFSMKLSMKNLMNEETEIEIGNVTVLEQEFGRNFGLDLSWEL